MKTSLRSLPAAEVDQQRSGLSLRIPEPLQRPGDAPDFSGVALAVAGEVRRPAVDAAPENMEDLAASTIRVLDDEGRAVGPWIPELSDDVLRAGLRDMIRVRAFDQRMLVAQRQGKTSFYMLCTGEEAVACAFQRVMRPGDMNFATYRQQGLLISAGYSLVDMACQVMSNSNDPLKGRQLPVMYSSKSYGFFSISGNLGTQFIQAVGWGMASAIKGGSAIAGGWIGDGATAESDFYSALVFASTYRSPVVLNVVNNQWAISTFQGIARGSARTFAARGLGFGIPSLLVDGNDFLAVYAAAQWAAERARRNLGPSLIEHFTYRSAAHSTSDDPSAYRPKDEYISWPLGDPIQRLKRHLIGKNAWSEEQHIQAVTEIEAETLALQKEAESFGTLRSGPALSPSEMFLEVYKDPPPHLRRQRQQAGF